MLLHNAYPIVQEHAAGTLSNLSKESRNIDAIMQAASALKSLMPLLKCPDLATAEHAALIERIMFAIADSIARDIVMRTLSSVIQYLNNSIYIVCVREATSLAPAPGEDHFTVPNDLWVTNNGVNVRMPFFCGKARHFPGVPIGFTREGPLRFNSRIYLKMY
jgi:hypothetical protein